MTKNKEIKLSEKQKEETKCGTMEDYIWTLLKRAEKELSEIKEDSKKSFMEEYNDLYPKKERFHFLQGRIDTLYMLITGHNNPLANPLTQ